MSNPSNVLALQQHGKSETIVIRKSKCLIRAVIDNQKVDCCAIFSGPNGTALRSYTSDVLVNGVPATVRPLVAGDEIELPCHTRLTVQAATEIRPVISGRQRSVEEIDQQLSSMTGQPQLTKQDPTVISQDPNEEKLLSPFSEDLPQLVADANANVANSTSETLVPAPNDTVAENNSIAQTRLDALFSTGANAEAPVEHAVQTQANDSSADNAAVANVEANNAVGGLDDIQRHLQSLMSETGPEAPQAETAIANDPGALGSTLGMAGVVGGIASAAAATVAASVMDSTNNETTSQQDEPMPTPAIPVEVEVTPTNTTPADLQNQLDELKASLESQTNNNTAAVPEFTSPATPAFTASAPIASPAIPVPPVSVPQPEFQSLPVEVAGTAVPPVAETPISTLPPVFAATEAIQMPVEGESEVAADAPAPSTNRSVAEILGQMGIDVPGAEDPALSNNVNQTNESPVPMPIPEPTQNAPETPVFANTPQATTEQVSSELDAEEGDAEDDIQAYMNQLLNRGSGEGAPTPAPIPEPVAIVEESVQQVVPLSAEEFVPNHKASRPANYESLREIANNSNRSAIELSTVKDNSGSILVRLFVAVAALVAGIITLCMGLGYIATLLLTISVIGFALYTFASRAENAVINEAIENLSQSEPS